MGGVGEGEGGVSDELVASMAVARGWHGHVMDGIAYINGRQDDVDGNVCTVIVA